jgi:hypothetical protein
MRIKGLDRTNYKKRFGDYDPVDLSYKSLDQLTQQAKLGLYSYCSGKYFFEDQYHYYHLPNSFNESRAQKELEHFKKVFKDYSFDEGVKMIKYN